MIVTTFFRALLTPVSTESVRVRRRFRILLSVVTSGLIVVSLAFLGGDAWEHPARLVGYVALGIVAGGLTAWPRLDAFWDRYGGVAAIGIVTGFVLLTGRVDSPYLVLYAINLLYGALFYDRRRLYAESGLVLLAIAAVVGLTGGADPRTVEVAIQVGAWVLFTAIVRGLVERLRTMTRAGEESEQRYRSLVEYNPDAVHLFALDGGFLSANPAALRMSGHTAEEVRAAGSLTLDALVAPDRLESTWRHFHATVAGEPQHFDTAIHHKDGSRVELQVATVPVRVDGEVVGVFSVSKDITEARESQRRLQARAAQQVAVGALGRRALEHTDLDALLNDAVRLVARTLDVPLCAVFERRASDWAVLRVGQGWNPAAVGEAIVPLTPDYVTGRASGHIDPVLVSPDADRWPQLFSEHGVTGGALTLVGRPSAPFGLLGAFGTDGRAIGGDAIGFLQTVASILGGALERSQAEQKLLQAQRMQAVGQLAGGIAHDFNNLLTALLGYQELVIPAVAGDPAAAQHLREAIDAARRAQALVDQLLTFSRGRVTGAAPGIVDAVVEDMRGLVDRLLSEGIEVVTKLDAVGVHTAVTSNQLEQVVLNLVVNARDAMPIGGRLEVTSEVRTLGPSEAAQHGLAIGAYVTLTVSDTGVGMNEEVRSRLFEPFFTTKPPGRGTGLGLPTVYGIVRQAGGRIEVESAPGAGSRFLLLLPVVEAPIAAPANVSASPGAEPEGAVLVVEDQAAVRSLVAEVLRQQGYEVLEARNGEEALTVAAGHSGRLGLLITDVVMPQLDGPGLARELRKRTAGLRVLYMSGYSVHPDLLDGEGLGRSAFLAKPFGVAELVQRARDLLAATIR